MHRFDLGYSHQCEGGRQCLISFGLCSMYWSMFERKVGNHTAIYWTMGCDLVLIDGHGNVR